MQRSFFLINAFLILVSFAIYSVFAGDPKKPLPAAATPRDVKAETRLKDSITYFKLTNEEGTYEVQNDTNTILLPNGLKLTFVKLTRLPVPRAVNVTLPDSFSQKSAYELGELEITATNTTSADIKLDGSEPVFVSLKLFSAENGWKGYPSQYSLSFGSYYLKTEPQQTEKMNAIYIASHDFLDKTYKAGQTKSFNGIIIPIPKAVRHFDRLVLYTREFGQNRSYGCPANL
jgi:hypothetical protein